MAKGLTLKRRHNVRRCVTRVTAVDQQYLFTIHARLPRSQPISSFPCKYTVRLGTFDRHWQLLFPETRLPYVVEGNDADLGTVAESCLQSRETSMIQLLIGLASVSIAAGSLTHAALAGKRRKPTSQVTMELEPGSTAELKITRRRS